MSEGRQASENFDYVSYKNAYRDLRNAFGNDKKKYYMHYINNGKSEGRKATGVTSLQDGVTTLDGIDYSVIYNYDYYVSHNPDVAKAFPNDDEAVLRHFVNNGMKEGRASSESFNLSVYKENNEDLRAAFGDDDAQYYMHYLRFGHNENRKCV